MIGVGRDRRAHREWKQESDKITIKIKVINYDRAKAYSRNI